MLRLGNVATPATAVGPEENPDSVPAGVFGALIAALTTVELSPSSTLPNASSIVTCTPRIEPAAASATWPTTSCDAAAGLIVNGTESVVSPPRVARRV